LHTGYVLSKNAQAWKWSVEAELGGTEVWWWWNRGVQHRRMREGGTEVWRFNGCVTAEVI